MTIFVGPQKEKFSAHEAIVRKVEFLENRLRYGTFQRDTMSIDLPDDNSTAFEYLLRFLYTPDVLPKELQVFRELSSEFGFLQTLIQKRVLNTYILAKRYCVENLCNAIVDLITTARPENRWHCKGIVLLRRAGLSDCLLRKFLVFKVASLIRTVGWDRYKELSSTFSSMLQEPEFREDMNDIAKALADYGNGADNNEEDACRWHVHVKTAPCNTEVEGSQGDVALRKKARMAISRRNGAALE